MTGDILPVSGTILGNIHPHSRPISIRPMEPKLKSKTSPVVWTIQRPEHNMRSLN